MRRPLPGLIAFLLLLAAGLAPVARADSARVDELLDDVRNAGAPMPGLFRPGQAALLVRQGAGYADVLVVAGMREEPGTLAALLERWRAQSGLPGVTTSWRENGYVAAELRFQQGRLLQHKASTSLPVGSLLAQLRADYPKLYAVAETPNYVSFSCRDRIGANDDRTYYDLSRLQPGAVTVAEGVVPPLEMVRGATAGLLPPVILALAACALLLRARLARRPSRPLYAAYRFVIGYSVPVLAVISFVVLATMRSGMRPSLVADVWLGWSDSGRLSMGWGCAFFGAFLGAATVSAVLHGEAQGTSALRPRDWFGAQAFFVVGAAVALSVYAFLLPDPWLWVRWIAAVAAVPLVALAVASFRHRSPKRATQPCEEPARVAPIAEAAKLSGYALKSLLVLPPGSWTLPTVSGNTLYVSKPVLDTLTPDELRYVTCWAIAWARKQRGVGHWSWGLATVAAGATADALDWTQPLLAGAGAVAVGALFGVLVAAFLRRDPCGWMTPHKRALKLIPEPELALEALKKLADNGFLGVAQAERERLEIERAAASLRRKGHSLSDMWAS